MDPGPTISRSYTRHKWVGRMICSHAIESACAQDFLRLPESMTIIKNRMDNLRFSFPLLIKMGFFEPVGEHYMRMPKQSRSSKRVQIKIKT